MFVSSIKRQSVAIKLLSLSIFISPSVLSANELSPARSIEVAVVSGEQLPALIGKELKDYSVMVVEDGELSPIPYQFDERNEGGFLYASGGSLAITGTEDVLDEEDELAFMLKDAGTMKASAEQLAAVPGIMINEVEVELGDHSRYAYIVEGNDSRSEKRYTHFDKETGLIKTSAYSLQVDPDNLLQWGDFMYEGFTANKSILDTMKLRVNAKLGFIKATVHNKFIPSDIVAVKNGPVRTIIEMDASIGILGVNVIQAGASVLITENSTQFPVFVTIPKAASVLSYLDIEVSLDMDNMKNARYRTELGPKEPVLQGGGGADPKDLKVDLEHNWLSLSSNDNWDIIAFFNRNKDITLTLEAL
ncbi:MAG: hypothetical protein KUG83_06985, partial [Gammaproteobacteria bacterium]|nr:hypothetical protein [Gammaproteobacteria bacterium]